MEPRVSVFRSLGKRAGFTGLWLLIAFSAVCIASAGPAQENGEHAALLEKQRALEARIAALNREQDFLLFQKAVSVMDSKYLILKIGEKRGQLRYKNRVLKDFSFLSASPGIARLGQGKLTLTGKIEGSKNRSALIFGGAFVLQARRADDSLERKTPRIYLARKDLKVLFNALEGGALAYVLP